MNTEHELIPRHTLTQMVEGWTRSVALIEQGHAALEEAERTLENMFPMSTNAFNVKPHDHNGRSEKAKETIDKARRAAWRMMVDKMQLRSLLSIQRAGELDKQLEKGELPEITVENVLAMVEQQYNQRGDYIKEAVQEVYTMLRRYTDRYKTNAQFRVDSRVNLSWFVEHNWSGNGFARINYHREQECRALDNVFHALDGKQLDRTHYGPLADAVSKTKFGEKGETDYFEFRPYKNRSLHIRFKRLDLLEKLNGMADPALGDGSR